MPLGGREMRYIGSDIMARIVALDYGRKRTGVAVTDVLQIIASGLKTVYTKDLLCFLKEYFDREKVAVLVVGMPSLPGGAVADLERDIMRFLRKVQNVFPDVVIDRVDERFTSRWLWMLCWRRDWESTRRRDKKLVDKVSATLILQSYMESRQFKDNTKSI